MNPGMKSDLSTGVNKYGAVSLQVHGVQKRSKR